MFLKKKCLNLFKNSGVLALKNIPKSIAENKNAVIAESDIQDDEIEVETSKKTSKKNKI